MLSNWARTEPTKHNNKTSLDGSIADMALEAQELVRCSKNKEFTVLDEIKN